MTQSESDRARALVPVALGVATIAVSFAAPLFRKASPTHPLAAAGIRLLCAALLLSPWTVRALRRGTSSGRLLTHAALAGVCYAVHFGAWVWSLTLTSVAASVTLVTTTPLVLAVIATITGRDRPHRSVWLSLALAAVGLSLIGGTDLTGGARVLIGDGLALLGALAMASYLLVGRRLGEAMDVPAFAGTATAVGAALLLATGALLGVPLAPASPAALGYLALAAVIPQLIGHNLLTWAVRHARPTTVGMAVVGEPVGATLLAWSWLGESVPLRVAAGCAVTLVAVGVAVRGGRERA
jgi:drug/metabolite transporter (DMT)-like permease